MYRPNQLGRAVLASVDQAVVAVSATELNLADGTGAVPKVWCPDANVNERTRMETFNGFNAAHTPGAGQQTGVGIQVSGAAYSPSVRATIVEYGFSCFAGLSVRMGVRPFLGRADVDGQIVVCSKYTVLPFDVMERVETAEYPSYYAGRGSVVLGDWKPAGVEGSAALVLGLTFINMSAVGTEKVEDFQASLSLYKYTRDIDTNDPNR